MQLISKIIFFDILITPFSSLYSIITDSLSKNCGNYVAIFCFSKRLSYFGNIPVRIDIGFGEYGGLDMSDGGLVATVEAEKRKKYGLNRYLAFIEWK